MFETIFRLDSFLFHYVHICSPIFAMIAAWVYRVGQERQDWLHADYFPHHTVLLVISFHPSQPK